MKQSNMVSSVIVLLLYICLGFVDCAEPGERVAISNDFGNLLLIRMTS